MNTATNTIANVIGFVDSEVLTLDADIFPTAGDGYAIYNSDNNQGCSIYIPQQAPSSLTVLTVGGDIIQFKKCGDERGGSILPVNVLRVFSTGTSLVDLIALW